MANRRIPWLAVTVAMMFLYQDAKATDPNIDLGMASSFAALSGSGVANAGATLITGDVGSFPTATTAGFGTVTFNGTKSDIYTNTPPFNFTDQMVMTLPSRFYRAVLYP